MPTPRTARTLARLVLAWFVFYVGAAIASPLLMPGRYDVICSADGIAKLMHSDSGGSGEAGAASLHCPLCMPAGAPPPPVPVVAERPAAPLAYALRSIPAARLAALTAAPLPARGPPSST